MLTVSDDDRAAAEQRADIEEMERTADADPGKPLEFRLRCRKLRNIHRAALGLPPLPADPTEAGAA